MDYINAATAADPANAEAYASFGDLFERKLWHELSIALADWVKTASAQARPLLELLEQFVVKFEGRMNQLRYAQLVGACVVASVDVSRVLTMAEGIARFEACLAEKRARLGAEASLYIELEALLLKLRSADDAQALRKVKEALETTKPTVDAMTGTTDTSVFVKFYSAEAEYYRRMGPPESFYFSALSLLAYLPADALPDEKRSALATDIALAALTGEGVYNFGEVLATPILENLKGTPNAWLGDLLTIFARGDIDAFNLVLHDNKASFDAQPALAAKTDFVKEKITLLALINLIFETPSHDRTLDFTTIAQRTRLADPNLVEWLVMRAMALNLVCGTIDQVDQVIEVSWVLPRVLDNDQINHLIDQLDALSQKTTTASDLLNEHTVELL